MKKIIGLIFAAAILVCGLSAADFAQTQTNPNSINHRERRQQRRIRNGVRSGELTPREARRLERQQRGIRRTEARDRRSGGSFTPRERRNLQRRLNRTNRHIYRQKHDRQEVPR